MVINAYVDESYVEPRTFALGCAMARGMDWLEINRQWKRIGVWIKNNMYIRHHATP